MADPKTQAWNNFVLNCDPDANEFGTARRAASLASEFMGMANNGGINSYLTASWNRDAHEVLGALQALGAKKCAERFSLILDGLGLELPVMSQDERWDILEAYWTDSLNDIDGLDRELDTELMTVLEAHVEVNMPYYLARG